MEMAFDAKVQIDTRSGNNIRKEKRRGKYAENYKIKIIHRNCLVDKKLTVVDRNDYVVNKK